MSPLETVIVGVVCVLLGIIASLLEAMQDHKRMRKRISERLKEINLHPPLE